MLKINLSKQAKRFLSKIPIKHAKQISKKVHIIWIWWIWVSAIARYYKNLWYEVSWIDNTNSKLIEDLRKEWISIVIWEKEESLVKNTELVIYSEAIPINNEDLILSKKMWIKNLSYPEALWEITRDKKLISVAWTHWKSTTTSLISIILKNSKLDFTSIVWTILKEFGGKNFYYRKKEKKSFEYFVLEACEYKESFLHYRPYIWIITNIESDHLDYYKTKENYIEAFENYILNIVPNWFLVINWEDKNCERLLHNKKLFYLRKDIKYILVFKNSFLIQKDELVERQEIKFSEEVSSFSHETYPDIKMKIPWEHILFDAKIAYAVCYALLGIKKEELIRSLENYSWAWRRMEIVWETINWNTLMSDYWHHPTEIKLTLEAIKKENKDKKLFTIFQPHQYSRTLDLLKDFINCFENTDKLVIPNIYESRDSIKDKKKINSEKLVSLINHKNKLDWKWLENTLKIIENYDKKNFNSSIILLLWAWNIDELRFKIKLKK